jgi:hypothetical protein
VAKRRQVLGSQVASAHVVDHDAVGFHVRHRALDKDQWPPTADKELVGAAANAGGRCGDRAVQPSFEEHLHCSIGHAAVLVGVGHEQAIGVLAQVVLGGARDRRPERAFDARQQKADGIGATDFQAACNSVGPVVEGRYGG